MFLFRHLKNFLRTLHSFHKIASTKISLKKFKNELDSGNIEKAIKLAQNIDKKNPLDHHVQYLLGYHLEQNGQAKMAEPLLRSAFDIYPHNQEYVYRYFLVLFALSKFSYAMPLIDQLITFQRNKIYLAAKAELLIKIEYFKEAYLLLAEAFSLDPADVHVRSNLVNLLLRCFSPLDAKQRYLELFSSSDYKKVCLLEVVSVGRIRDRYRFFNLGNGKKVAVTKPNILGEHVEIETGSIQQNDSYVLELTKVTAFSECNVLKLSDDEAFYDVLNHPRSEIVNLSSEPVIKSHLDKKLLIDSHGYNEISVESGIFLIGALTSAFGHWIFEFLPKLISIEKIPEFADLSIYVDQNMPASHFEILRILVGADRKIIKIPPKTAVHFQKLIFSPTVDFQPYNIHEDKARPLDNALFSPEIITYLRTKIISNLGSKTTPDRQRIYLDRSHALWRKVKNEKQIISYLSKFGFKVVALQNYSFLEQFYILQSAECVIGALGSAMNNTMFCQPDCQIGILSPPQIGNYTSWANAMGENGFNLLFVCGEQSYLHKNLTKHSDFSVPLSLIERTLSEFKII